MKKKLVVLFVLLCFICNSIFGYEDFYNNEEAHAYYEGTSDTVNIQAYISKYKDNLMALTWPRTFHPNLSKLTKRETQLLEIALEEYDLKPKEIYSIYLSLDYKALFIIALINSGSNDSYNYTWWGLGWL